MFTIVLMDVGDGLRLPLKDIIEQNGIPIMVRNPLTYGEAGNDTSHPAYIDIEKENSIQTPEVCTLSQILQTKPPQQRKHPRRRVKNSYSSNRAGPRPPRI